MNIKHLQLTALRFATNMLKDTWRPSVQDDLEHVADEFEQGAEECLHSGAAEVNGPQAQANV